MTMENDDELSRRWQRQMAAVEFIEGLLTSSPRSAEEDDPIWKWELQRQMDLVLELVDDDPKFLGLVTCTFTGLMKMALDQLADRVGEQRGPDFVALWMQPIKDRLQRGPDL